MTNQVTYHIDLIPENAEKIDAINKIVLGEAYTASAPTKSSAAATESTKAETTSSKAASAPETSVTLDDVKNAAKKCKRNHGEDFANSVLDEFGVSTGASLGRRMSAIDEADYEAIIAKWAEGPQATEQASDEPEDDDFEDDDDDDGLDDDEAEVTADAVKTALKAYAKDTGREEAKAIMTKHGAKALSDVDNLPAAKLAAMFKELV